MENKKNVNKTVQEEEVKMESEQVKEMFDDLRHNVPIEGSRLFVHDLADDKLYLYLGDDPLINGITYPVEVGIVMPKTAFAVVGARKIESLLEELLESLND